MSRSALNCVTEDWPFDAILRESSSAALFSVNFVLMARDCAVADIFDVMPIANRLARGPGLLGGAPIVDVGVFDNVKGGAGGLTVEMSLIGRCARRWMDTVAESPPNNERNENPSATGLFKLAASISA